MSEPIRIVAVRWSCPHCARSRAKRSATVEHIDRCWQNPDARGCKICANYQPPMSGCSGGYDCNCPPEVEACAAGVDLTDGLRIHCPAWEMREWTS